MERNKENDLFTAKLPTCASCGSDVLATKKDELVVRESEEVISSELLEVQTLGKTLSQHTRRIEELERLLASAEGRDESVKQLKSRTQHPRNGYAQQNPPISFHLSTPVRPTPKKLEDSAMGSVVRSPVLPGSGSSTPLNRAQSAGGDAKQPNASSSFGVPSFTDRLSASTEPMKLFDQDQLRAIYDKPYSKRRQQAALVGGGILGLMSIPFGPIGMAAGAMFGALCGAAVGCLVDRRTENLNLHESEREKKRLRSLVRWATMRSHDDEEIIRLLEVVILEFKPIADIASGSKNARKLLKHLDAWISLKNVTRQLWVYMDRLLTDWRNLNRGAFLKSMRVFQTLSTMYKHSQRVLDDHEEQFLERIERLLAHDSVKSVMAHAQLHPTLEERQVMECMVYADALRKNRRQSKDVFAEPRSPSNASKSPGNPDIELGELSDDSEDELETYAPQKGISGGLVFSPMGISPQRDQEKVQEAVESKPRMVLKKPFFRSWDDFMDFDLTFKHQMPITLSEFDLLLQKESESTKGWEVCVERKEIRVAKQQDPDVGFVTLRAWATIPGVDMQAAFYLFYNFNERVKWDKVFAKMDLIGTGENGSDLLYSLMKVPGITPRDFLQFRRVRIMEDGSIIIVLRSGEHPACPENKGIIRAESYISGYVLREGVEDGAPALKLFIMSCSDVKGLIPLWVINYLAPKKPAEWVETLRKAALDYQKANPNFKEKLEEYKRSFMIENPFDYEPDNQGHAEQHAPQPQSHPQQVFKWEVSPERQVSDEEEGLQQGGKKAAI